MEADQKLFNEKSLHGRHEKKWIILDGSNFQIGHLGYLTKKE